MSIINVDHPFVEMNTIRSESIYKNKGILCEHVHNKDMYTYNHQGVVRFFFHESIYVFPKMEDLGSRSTRGEGGKVDVLIIFMSPILARMPGGGGGVFPSLTLPPQRKQQQTNSTLWTI